MEAVVENVAQNVVENVVQDNLAGQFNPEPVVDQQIGEQAAQQIIETVSEIQSNIQPEMVPQVEEVVNQAVNQETFVTEVASQATSEAVTEAVTFVESVTERVDPPIVENVVETIVSESAPIIETVSETFETPEAPVVMVESQVPETVSEVVSEVVTEVQTEVTTLFTEDESSIKSSLISKVSTTDYIQWAQETHLIMTISISMVYLFIILLIRRLLSKRSPFHLRSLMFLWNLIRVVLHIAQTVTLVRLLAPVIKQESSHISKLLCHTPVNGPFGDKLETILFWVHIFTFVKLIEFVDTLFVVLRKQQLTLSHIYYRITTLIYAFYICGSKFVPSYYPLMVLIHVTYLSIMSFYYLVRSRSILAPKWIIYTLNLISLIKAAGLSGILSFSLYQHLYKEPCSPSMSTDVFGLIIVGTNTILFINYLRSTITKPKTIKLL